MSAQMSGPISVQTEKSDRILARLMALHPKKIDLSLGRMERLLSTLGHPERKLPPVFHVAGTNGKGSTVAYLRAMLEAAGKRVHVYTSPHLVRFAERIRLAGSLIEEDHLAAILERCEAANGDAPITYFEITTAAALLAFAETPADATLLEVGLGGRLDATNVIDTPLVTAITPVSMDHQDFLGDSLAAIATEKAGIAKPKVPLVLGPQAPDALAAIEGYASRISAPILRFGEDWNARTVDDGMVYEDRQGAIILPAPALNGRHQITNAGLAIACLRQQNILDLNEADYAAGLQAVDWPARFQDISNAPGLPRTLKPGVRIYLDGGHNPAAGSVLGDTLQAVVAETGGRVTLIMGMMANKDAAGFLAPLGPYVERLIAVPIEGEAAHTPEALVRTADQLGLRASIAPDFRAALNDAKEADRVLICGSLYLAGQVLKAVDLLPR